jgi:hypothetical protein
MAVERAEPVLSVAAGRDAEPGVHVDALRRQPEDPREKSGQHVPAVIDAGTAVGVGRARGVNRLNRCGDSPPRGTGQPFVEQSQGLRISRASACDLIVSLFLSAA